MHSPAVWAIQGRREREGTREREKERYKQRKTKITCAADFRSVSRGVHSPSSCPVQGRGPVVGFSSINSIYYLSFNIEYFHFIFSPSLSLSFRQTRALFIDFHLIFCLLFHLFPSLIFLLFKNFNLARLFALKQKK